MSTPVACEVALRCTSPEGPDRVCAFYSTYTPPTPGYPGWCKYVSTPAAFCGHPEARLIAFRAAVLEALGFMSDEDREAEKRRRIEERVKNDECPDCGLKLTLTDDKNFISFDGEAKGLKRVLVTCQRCKTFTTRIYTKDGKECPWGELTSMAKKGEER
jgi:hypothetical protein